MILFMRGINEKQYYRANYTEGKPMMTPKKGWRAGMKYTDCSGKVFIVDSVDAEKKHGELRLHVTRVK